MTIPGGLLAGLLLAAAPEASPCPGDPAGADASWTLATTTYDTAYPRHPFLGNGYLGQRVPPAGTGSMTLPGKTGWPLYTPPYDGSFVAGLYARDPQLAGGREAIAALPTWTPLLVEVGGETYSPGTPADRISNYRQALFLRCGLLRTSLTWTAADGRATDLVYEVVASRTLPHVGAVRLALTPRWSGPATVTDVLDGAGARRITATGGAARPDGTIDVTFRTITTNVAGTVASTLRGPREGTRAAGAVEGLTARQSFAFPVREGETYEVVKYVGVDTAQTAPAPRVAALRASRAAATLGWGALLAADAAAWRRLWRSDVVLPGQPELQSWVRAALHSLLSSARAGVDASLAPAGLSSDNYAGLVFWDAETWMYPGLLALHPDVARSTLDYRYRTMPAARANARALGLRGTLYPWNSGSRGDVPTECHSVDPPHCRTQVHLQGDVALAAWQYFLATGDRAWLRARGWPILQAVAEFFASRAVRNADGSYSLDDVAGPDEYSNGVNDAVFTNAGAAVALRNAARAARILGLAAPAAWTAIADRLRIPFDAEKQVFLQYDGYRGTKIKQADTVLLLYPLEWPMPREVAARTLDFYAQLTDPEGPAMTDSVHAIDAAAIGEPGCATYTYLMRSIRPFVREPFAQFAEARGEKAGAHDALAGYPALSFHTGSGGFLQVFTHGLTGLRLREDRVVLDPLLPPQLADGVTVTGLDWQGRTFDVAIGPRETIVTLTSGPAFRVETPRGGGGTLAPGRPLTLPTRRPDLEPTRNAARCAPARATTAEPGFYAEAAVDGSRATTWVPDGAAGELTVDLGATARLARIVIDWAETAPPSARVEVSEDAATWTPIAMEGDGLLAQPTPARYVRVHVERGDPASRPGIREIEVVRAP
jgi:trehalose/maltose hydrolase-like predicted phosphorylase